MKKIQLVLFLFIAGFMSVNAQVRIGSDENPHEGSILDLTNSKNRGLKLPTVSLQNAEILQVGGSAADEDLTAVGMVVYNTNTYALYGKGLYVWDGYKWNAMSAEDETLRIATCLPDYYAPDKTKKVTITVKNTLKDNTADPLYGKYAGAESIKLTFLTYNLGANPNLTPKQQMAYVSTLTNKTYTDITVYGGLYQWGRSDAAHSFRCDYDDDLDTNHPDLFTQDLYTSAT
ncbi:MAG: hypothetical protein LBG77_04975, partial [Dysgonamonadaceae bacterium]|nr:hypothetical protein [Dysgonamonadaceae bacterium]